MKEPASSDSVLRCSSATHEEKEAVATIICSGGREWGACSVWMFAPLTPLSSPSSHTVLSTCIERSFLLPEPELYRTAAADPLCVQFMYVCMCMSLSLFSRHTYRDCEPMEWHPVTHIATSSYTHSVLSYFRDTRSSSLIF